MSRTPKDPIQTTAHDMQEQTEQISFELDFFAGILERDPSNIRVLVAQAENFSLLGSYRESLPLDIRLTRLKPERSIFWYNLACSYARLQMADAAFEALDEAIGRGYDDFVHMLKDNDLKSLRSDPRFTAIVKRFKSRLAAATSELRKSSESAE